MKIVRLSGMKPLAERNKKIRANFVLLNIATQLTSLAQSLILNEQLDAANLVLNACDKIKEAIDV